MAQQHIRLQERSCQMQNAATGNVQSSLFCKLDVAIPHVVPAPVQHTNQDPEVRVGADVSHHLIVFTIQMLQWET